METELLIIKSGSKYIRIKEGRYLLCGLDKASVFPMEKLEDVKNHLEKIKEKGRLSSAIFKLILREEPLSVMDQPPS